MDQKFLDEQKRELLIKKTNLENELKKETEKTHDNHYKTVYPDYGTNEDEATDEVSAFEKNLNVNKNLEKILHKVDKALEKIKKGQYGTCSDCGQQISKDRLKAYPEADLCIDCQEEH